jgi:hypothetical protein
MKALHLTYHKGTMKNIQNVFEFLGMTGDLTTEKCHFPAYISKTYANELWKIHQTKWNRYKVIIITDTSMIARPFLQNMSQHNLHIIIYVTNRFNWGIWEKKDEDFYQLYNEASKTNRVFFCSDNRYDQYHTQLHQIYFFYKDIIRLTPKLKAPQPPIHSKFFIYNRGTPYDKYKEYLKNISHDVFGEHFEPFRDLDHIIEYQGIIHLPYQTNIQSLWENLGYCNVYFIPSQKCITQWILHENWYYWEEKNKNPENILKSIELAEWYQKDIQDLFVYFDDWSDLQKKIHETNILDKKNFIYQKVKNIQQNQLLKWKKILNLTI